MQKKLTIIYVTAVSLLLLLAFVFASVLIFQHQKNEPENQFKLTLINTETSMDSHSTSEDYSIIDNTLVYRWQYTGYHPDKDFRREKEQKTQLSNDELHKFKTILTRLNPSEVFTPAPVASLEHRENIVTISLRNNSPHLNIQIKEQEASLMSSHNYTIITELRNFLFSTLTSR